MNSVNNTEKKYEQPKEKLLTWKKSFIKITHNCLLNIFNFTADVIEAHLYVNAKHI